jgi:4-hydroxy-tetrahydrodipicolinate synthase
VALFGTTGEANSFSVKERMAALEAVLKSGVTPAQLMIGTGCCALPDTIELTRHALANGCHHTLVLPPFYYKNASDDGLLISYSEMIEGIADTTLNVFLYHIPPVSQTPISGDLINNLVTRFPEVIAGVKDSSGDLDNTLSLSNRFPQLAIFPGAETFLLTGLQNGCVGCISATANANPTGIRRIYDSFIACDGSANALQEKANRVREAFVTYPAIAALKHYAATFYGDTRWRTLRPPLVGLPEDHGQQLLNDLKHLDLPME